MSICCFSLPQFGVACERSRLTHLWGEPLALVAGQEGKEEVRVASDEALAQGIRPGQSVSAARALCAGLHVLPYDRVAYETAAHLIWDAIAIESSVVEPVSPELCFAEMTGRDVAGRVRRLAEGLAQSVRIPLRVGLAGSKLLAERAAIESREGEALEVPIGTEAAFLSSMPIECLHKLDIKVRQRLRRLGVRTLGDVLRLPPSELRRQFRDVGLLIQRLAVGEDADPVKPLYPPRRLSCAYAFEDEVEDMRRVEEALWRCSRQLAAQLCRNREFCRSAALRVQMAGGACAGATEQLAMPADGAEAIQRSALRLLARAAPRQPITAVELQVSELGAGSGVQLSLMDGNAHGVGLPHERRARLEAALAHLRRKFGIGAVVTLHMLATARRIDLWAPALTRRRHELVDVTTDEDGAPILCVRRSRRGGVRHMEIRRVQNLWKETKWFWGAASTRAVYRVETAPGGVYELQRLGVEWRLAGVAD